MERVELGDSQGRTPSRRGCKPLYSWYKLILATNKNKRTQRHHETIFLIDADNLASEIMDLP